MKTGTKLSIVLMTILAASCVQPAISWIADVKAVPDRFWNREVVFEGQVDSAQPDPPGTTRGYYRLVDESDPNGILVRTTDLPAPGRVYRVSGVIIQDPSNAVVPILDETRRRGAIDWLLFGSIAMGALALILLVIIIVGWLRGKEEEPETRVSDFDDSEEWGTSGSSGWSQGPTQPFTTPEPPQESEDTKIHTPQEETIRFRPYGHLEVIEGPDAGKDVPLGMSPFYIGRGGKRKNHFEVSDQTVSREQAKILYDQESSTVSLVNESVTNKSRINGKPVDSHHLGNGDRIEFGATVAVFHARD